MKTPKLIYVEWMDATSHASWIHQQDMNDWLAEEYPIVYQVGWLYEETAKEIVLYSRWGYSIFTNDGPQEKSYGNLQRIPKTWIRKRRILKV